jgi:hypothetical protein
VTRRTALLATLLLLVAGLAAWSRVQVQELETLPAIPRSDGLPAAPLDASALSLERHPGPVADEANALSHFSDTLTWQAKTWREDLGIEVHVVTLAAPDLPSETLAAEVFQIRKVGADAPTGGLLVLLNPERREARIEVSYALEPALPDAFVGRIAHDQLAPYAGYQMAGMAVMDALHFLQNFLLQQAVEGRLALAESYRQRPAFLEKARFLSGGGGASVRVPSAEELAGRDFKAAVPEAQRPRYAAADDPIGSAEALLRVHRDLAGDPSLDLFTPGSRCMRRGYPVAPYEELERARTLEASKPWRAVVQADRAVVTSDHPAPGFVPVLLENRDGLWRVDLPETWKNLFFGRDGNYRLRNSNNPYRFGLAAFGSGEPYDLEPWSLGAATIEETLAALERKGGPLSEFLQGELLFRNCFLALDALTHYENASKRGSDAQLFHETLGRRAEYLGFYDLAIEAYGRLDDFGVLDVARMYVAKGDFAGAVHPARRAVQRNPYDREALEVLRSVLAASGDAPGASEAEAQLAALAGDPKRAELPVGVRFDPPDPALMIDEPTLVGTTQVFDHSFFSVTLENPSQRPIEILRVTAHSLGTGGASGLGDIKNYWRYPSGGHRLAAGEQITLAKTWGFTVDTRADQLRYVFDVCWRGEGEPPQCRAEPIDLFPR